MLRRCSWFAAALVAALGGALAAQGGRPLRVDGVRELSFGTVLPGIPRQVLRTDPVASGEFQIRGEKFNPVELTFALPTLMTGPAGASMPVLFGGNDAGYSVTQSIASQVGFDPSQPFQSQLDKDGRASVFLGGTANPMASQRSGSYSGTVTLTVAYLP
ncbi:MAG TPA: DUF4402 domain-containing protein [Gemmatimonadales bacterium]